MKPSKRYRKAAQLVEQKQNTGLADAFKALLQTPAAKFDETVEISAHLGVDPKQSDQMVRGTVALPHGSGRSVRVVVFTENPQEALAAGAEHAGLEDLIQKVQDGWMDFDVAIATTTAMKLVRNVARVLGPRGLMPNPKSGTVTDNITEGVKAVKAGRVEFKMDKTANVHIIVGKRSFSDSVLFDNARVALDTLGKARPEGFKGKFIHSLAVSSTMSPSVAIDTKEFNKY